MWPRSLNELEQGPGSIASHCPKTCHDAMYKAREREERKLAGYEYGDDLRDVKSFIGSDDFLKDELH